jgi:hypothetical protein
MSKRIILSLSAIAALALAFLPSNAIAQQKPLKEQIVGTWTLASWEQTYPDGRKDQAFGTPPKGVNMFGADGRFTLIFLRPDLPKVASNDRVKQTPQESQAISLGSIAYYGTYTVNEQEKSLDLKLDGTTFTNQLGMPQKRMVTLINNDELRYRNPTATSGGSIEVALKRAK